MRNIYIIKFNHNMQNMLKTIIIMKKIIKYVYVDQKMKNLKMLMKKEDIIHNIKKNLNVFVLLDMLQIMKTEEKLKLLKMLEKLEQEGIIEIIHNIKKSLNVFVMKTEEELKLFKILKKLDQEDIIEIIIIIMKVLDIVLKLDQNLKEKIEE